MRLDNEEPPHFRDRKPQTQQVKQDCNNSGAEISSSHLLNFDAYQLENGHSSFARRFWEWTGLGKTTLLEILRFLMIFVPLVTFVADQRERELARQESYRKEIKLAQKEVLSNYLDEMKEFLLSGQLSQEPVQRVARAETFSVLRQLDGEQRGELLRFLYEIHLIGNQCKTDMTTLETISCQEPIIELNGARLDEATFDAPLIWRGISLAGASLVDTRLSRFDLSEAEMAAANLKGADLSGALLSEVRMERANLENAMLTRAFLRGANLSNANLTNANLQDATMGRQKVASSDGTLLPGITLTDAILQNTNLKGADLTQSRLNNSNLQEANLSNAILTGANLQNSNLENANLQGSDLRDADLTDAILQGTDLKESKYNNSTKFPEGFNPDGQGMHRVD